MVEESLNRLVDIDDGATSGQWQAGARSAQDRDSRKQVTIATRLRTIDLVGLSSRQI